MIFIYTWLSEILQKEYEPVRLMKESPRGNIRLIRHRASGRKFVLRRFRGNAGVYRKLLNFSCENLPQIYEVAEKNGENLILEEFVEGDTLGFLLERYVYSPEKETRQIPSCRSAALYGLSILWALFTGM